MGGKIRRVAPRLCLVNRNGAAVARAAIDTFPELFWSCMRLCIFRVNRLSGGGVINFQFCFFSTMGQRRWPSDRHIGDGLRCVLSSISVAERHLVSPFMTGRLDRVAS
jgi:hypothetical protein